METTSQIAYTKFKSEGKKNKHHNIILGAFKNDLLSSYGISQRTGLTTVEVSRRTSELVRLNKIECVCRVLDKDGARRNAFRKIARD